MSATASQVMRIAKSQIGYKERPSGSNRTKFGKAYGMNGTYWCAIFVWWCFKQANASELYYGGKKTAYVPTLADYYIEHKRIVKKTHGKLGDIVFFDFDRNGNSDHVGFIWKYLGNGYYKTLEGNTGNGNNSNGGQVMFRKRHVSQISRIARPKYKKVVKKTAKKKTDVKKYPTLKLWSKGKYVKLIQKKLGIKVDGVFGTQTEKAVKRYQKKKGLKPDGIVGQQTWKSILKK